MKLYSIYDNVAKRFNAPFVSESDDVANRSFQYGLKGDAFASDMDLYCLGSFVPDASVDRLVVISQPPTFVSHFVGEVIDNG